MQNYKAGLYLRLSKDDNNSDSESISITNQRTMLTEYANERRWDIEDIYIDDGISGVTFERPSFQRMVKDIESKRINMVICKDLSRLGRNYVKVGEYTDFFFPRHNIRFIAINENIDSDNDNDIAGFLNIINEHYAKDISRKVKSTKLSQMKKGQYIGSYTPLGYKRDPMDKHRFVIDDEGAKVVRRIYHLYSLGNSARHIADTFNQEGIPTARDYYFNSIGKPNPFTFESSDWGSATIMRLLGNQVYQGHMCQGKRQKKSFKMKRRDTIPEDKWIVVKDTHKAIIDEVTWDRVQAILKSNKHTEYTGKQRLKKDNTVSLFSRKLKCTDCGASMTFTYSKSGEAKAYYKYRCSTYNNQGKTACSFNSILENDIKVIVLNEIKRFSKISTTHTDILLEKLIAINARIVSKDNFQTDQQIKKTEVGLKNVSIKIDVLLEQMANKNISDGMFKRLMNEYESKQVKLNEHLIELKSLLSAEKDNTKNIKHLIKNFKDRIYIEELDRETVIELIDYVKIFKKVKVGTKYTQKIEIYFNFVGQISKDDLPILKEYKNDIIIDGSKKSKQAN